MTSNLATSRRAAVDAFLERNRQELAAGRGRGRLIFALDATQSRRPTWDVACQTQDEMFQAAGAIGLGIQFIYFRGLNECRASQCRHQRENPRRANEQDRLPDRHDPNREGAEPCAARV